MPIDILVAPQDQFDRILRDINNTSDSDVTQDTDVSIDDVVTIIAIHRNAIDDHPSWWKIRREVNSRFLSHSEIPTRTLALIPETVRDEVANLTNNDVRRIADRWLSQNDATPPNKQRAVDSLAGFVAACQKALAESKGVFLRTNQPRNAFELAFSQLDGKSLANFRKAFDKWDDTQKYDAHQKYNYYCNQGLDNSLALVLRDLTRPSTKKVNLKTDQRTIRRHIEKRIKEYCKAPNPTLGSSQDVILLITLTFDIEYEGYVDLGFDTRPDALSDIRWEERTEDCLEFAHWNEGLQRFSCDALPLNVSLHDGSKAVVSPDSEADAFDTYIGNMLRDTLMDMRQSGKFANLPLGDDCFMLVGGTHSNYAWPIDGEFDRRCRANLEPKE